MFFYLTDLCVYQIQEKHLGTNKLLYMAVVDLKNAIDRVLGDVIWWAMGNKELTNDFVVRGDNTT